MLRSPFDIGYNEGIKGDYKGSAQFDSKTLKQEYLKGFNTGLTVYKLKNGSL